MKVKRQDSGRYEVDTSAGTYYILRDIDGWYVYEPGQSMPLESHRTLAQAKQAVKEYTQYPTIAEALANV